MHDSHFLTEEQILIQCVFVGGYPIISATETGTHARSRKRRKDHAPLFTDHIN